MGAPSLVAKKSFLVALAFLLCSTAAFALANPSTVYCNEMGREFGGYQYVMKTDSDSNQYGICIMPDGTQCDSWDFFHGKCGNDFSYCAKNGYGTTIISNGTSEYAACVLPGNSSNASAPGTASLQEIPIID